MGGSTKTSQSTTSKTDPWKPTIGPLNDIIGQVSPMIGNTGLNATENQALDTLSQNASAGNPFAAQIGSLATDLLGGGVDRTGAAQSSFNDLNRRLTPFADGQYVDPSSNPQLKAYMDVMSNDIMNRTNGMFAAAGRDFSGANVNAVSRGLAEGLAPTMLQAYDTERNRQLGAIDALYTGGNQTTNLLSGLDQTSLGNRSAGIEASSAAQQAQDSAAQQQLAIEAQRRGIPLSNISDITGILGPIAQLGQQGSSNTTSTTKTPLAQQIMGGLIGGLGLAGQMGGFGSSGWLYGTGGTGLLGNLFKR